MPRAQPTLPPHIDCGVLVSQPVCAKHSFLSHSPLSAREAQGAQSKKSWPCPSAASHVRSSICRVIGAYGYLVTFALFPLGFFQEVIPSFRTRHIIVQTCTWTTLDTHPKTKIEGPVGNLPDGISPIVTSAGIGFPGMPTLRRTPA